MAWRSGHKWGKEIDRSIVWSTPTEIIIGESSQVIRINIINITICPIIVPTRARLWEPTAIDLCVYQYLLNLRSRRPFYNYIVVLQSRQYLATPSFTHLVVGHIQHNPHNTLLVVHWLDWTWPQSGEGLKVTYSLLPLDTTDCWLTGQTLLHSPQQ